MSQLFTRKYALTIGDLRISELRVSFTCEKSTDKAPNTAEIKIYNLSEKSRGQIQKKGLFVTLEAGYGDDVGTIFKGELRQVQHVREAVDWVTTIWAGDAERKTLYSYMSDSFKPGVDSTQIVQRCIQKLSLIDGNSSNAFLLRKKTYAGGVSFVGSAYDLLSREAKACKLKVSVQNGVVVFVPIFSVTQADLKTFPAVRLNAKTGLIGSPEHSNPDKKGDTSPNLKIKSLLQHQLQASGYVQIDAETVKGNYLIEKVKHTGDSFGADWYSELEVVPL